MPASTRLKRRSLQVASMIRSTSRLSISPTGCSSALRRSANSFKASSSSPGRRTSWERRPCVVALRRAVAFPSGVLGPLPFRAFRLLASICFLLVMLVPFHSLGVGSIKAIVLRRRCIPKRQKPLCNLGATRGKPQDSLTGMLCSAFYYGGAIAVNPCSLKVLSEAAREASEVLPRYHGSPL